MFWYVFKLLIFFIDVFFEKLQEDNCIMKNLPITVAQGTASFPTAAIINLL